MPASAKYVMRNRQHLTAVQELQGDLCLTTLRFAEDLVEPSFIADRREPRGDQGWNPEGGRGQAAAFIENSKQKAQARA